MNKRIIKVLLASIIAISAIISLASCDMLPAELQDMLGIGGECKHANVEWVTDMAATCKFEGTNHSVCSDCGEIVEYGKIPVADHALGEWEIDYESTCIKQGSHYKKCTTCKAKVLVEELPLSTEHAYELGMCTDCRAVQPESAGLVFTSNGDGTCVLAGIGSCTDSSLVVPATSPAGDTVTSVAATAFLDKTFIKSLVLPDTISSAGLNAFTGCPIVKASVPAAVVPAVRCSTIVELTITGTGMIPDAAMSAASDLKKVHIKEGVTGIGEAAFMGCKKLHHVGMPESLTTIGASALAQCTSLRLINIGTGVTTIGEQAFANSTGLETVTIPASVKFIGKGAFVCSALSNKKNTSSLENVEFAVTEGWFATSAPGAGYGANIESAELDDNSLAASALNSVYGGYHIKRN